MEQTVWYQPSVEEQEQIVTCARGGLQRLFLKTVLQFGSSVAPLIGPRTRGVPSRRIDRGISWHALNVRLNAAGWALEKTPGTPALYGLRSAQGHRVRRFPDGLYRMEPDEVRHEHV